MIRRLRRWLRDLWYPFRKLDQMLNNDYERPSGWDWNTTCAANTGGAGLKANTVSVSGVGNSDGWKLFDAEGRCVACSYNMHKATDEELAAYRL